MRAQPAAPANPCTKASASAATSPISPWLCRCMNIPARYCTGYLGRHRRSCGYQPRGLQRLGRGVSRRALVHDGRAPQPSPHRSHCHGARPRRGRRRYVDSLRRRQPRALCRGDPGAGSARLIACWPLSHHSRPKCADARNFARLVTTHPGSLEFRLLEMRLISLPRRSAKDRLDPFATLSVNDRSLAHSGRQVPT
jgi:hypothetical protein